VRASRLVALLLHLQRTGSATSAELAELFDVSVRTIYRDVSALQAAGAPLWTETGPGGGVRLLDGWRTDLDGLTSEEAAALFLGGLPAVAGDLGLGSVLAAAQVKMLAALSPDAAVRAAAARSRFLLDAPGWFARDEATPALPTLAGALWDDERIELQYEVGERVRTRRVEPFGLVLKAGVWYLVGRNRGALRTYRVSRVRDARRVGGGVVRPPEFDLARTWAQVGVSFDRDMRPESALLWLREDATRRLARAVPGEATTRAVAAARSVREDADTGERWLLVDLPVESVLIAAHQLVGLVDVVEVVEPPELRAALGATGAALVARYADPAPVRAVAAAR
jgi:predicted DNA-binding transcriptional regulator YafY